VIGPRHLTTTPLMAIDMAEQPAVVASVLRRRHRIAAAVRAVLPCTPRAVVLVGQGSSAHAADFGRYLFAEATGRPAELVPPGLAIGDHPPDAYAGYLAIGISQSGETAEVAGALASLGAAGAATVAITNDPSSAVARIADTVIDLAAGVERAIPATKTFTATLAALVGAVGAFSPAPCPWFLEALPGALDEVLVDMWVVDRSLARLPTYHGWACLGSGLLKPVADETALKLEEAGLVTADSYSVESFRHGPIATAGPQRPVLVFAAEPSRDVATRHTVEDLRRRGSPVVLASPSIHADLLLPPLPEPLLPFAAAVRGQQLALAIAQRRGLDPDHPPGLTKVTRP
jgi:glucosamine--fructose-6-phosphate aminotransferase (isomerizing)